MTPREFLQRYGGAIPRTLVFNDATPQVFPEHLDRYLLYFMFTGSQYTIKPNSNLNDNFGGMQVSATLPDRVFTHALHGALVNLAWVVTPFFPPQTVTIIEAFMPMIVLPTQEEYHEFQRTHEGKPNPPDPGFNDSPAPFRGTFRFDPFAPRRR